MRRHAFAAAPVHCVLPLLLTVVLLLAATSDGIRPAPPAGVKMAHGQGTPTAALQVGRSGGDSGFLLQEAEVYATGSSLPDCSHACGACSPCNRVMVSFKCSIAEPCPMVYRCMCKGKCYPVPSS